MTETGQTPAGPERRLVAEQFAASETLARAPDLIDILERIHRYLVHPGVIPPEALDTGFPPSVPSTPPQPA